MIEGIFECLSFSQGGISQLARTLFLQLFLLQTSVAATDLDPDNSVSAAAHGIALQVWYFLLFSQDALAVAAQSLVAKELGRKDICNARSSSDRVLQIGLACGMVTALGVGMWGFICCRCSDDRYRLKKKWALTHF